MGHLLNPVFRSIAPKNNHPKNLPVHGLNVIAFARIQTSLNGGLRASLDPSTLRKIRADIGQIAFPMP
jgi:hypothetical protein